MLLIFKQISFYYIELTLNNKLAYGLMTINISEFIIND